MGIRSPFPLVMALLALLPGCLIIPTDYYQPYSRKNVGQEMPSGLEKGSMSREGVLLSLGEPDRSSQDETEFWYIASKVKAVIIVGDRGSEAGVDYVHVVRFDAGGLVGALDTMTTNSGEIADEGGRMGVSYYLEPHFFRSPEPLPGSSP